MASSISNGDKNLQPAAGLEIIPYVPAPVDSAKFFDRTDIEFKTLDWTREKAPVKREDNSYEYDLAPLPPPPGFENHRVIHAQPLSVGLPVGFWQMQAAALAAVTRFTGAVIVKKRRPGTYRTTKLLDITYVSFDYIKTAKGSNSSVLKIYEDPEPINIMELDVNRYSKDEKALPMPIVLKRWKKECRVRLRNGLKDKFYTHPLSLKKYRSLVDVTRFINKCNGQMTPLFATPVQGSDIQVRRILSARKNPNPSENRNKRKNAGSFSEPKPRRARISFPIVLAAEDERARQEREVLETLATAWNNLMKLEVPPPPQPASASVYSTVCYVESCLQQLKRREDFRKQQAASAGSPAAAATAAAAGVRDRKQVEVIVLDDDDEEDPPKPFPYLHQINNTGVRPHGQAAWNPSASPVVDLVVGNGRRRGNVFTSTAAAPLSGSGGRRGRACNYNPITRGFF